LSSKIEMSLQKAVGGRWEDLELKEEISKDEKKPAALNQTKDWDKLAKDITDQEAKDIEEGGGDAALQQMFKVNLYFCRGSRHNNR
jgi:hypothetical protein